MLSCELNRLICPVVSPAVPGLLLTATPMYNKANEIIEILTLLYANDKRDYRPSRKIFLGRGRRF